MTLNEVEIADTFAEAFPMTAARVLVTAETADWARTAPVVGMDCVADAGGTGGTGGWPSGREASGAAPSPPREPARTEAVVRQDKVVVDHAQAAETHPLRVVIIREAETVICVEPAMIGVPPFICFSYSHHGKTLARTSNSVKYHVSCLAITFKHT